MLTVTYFYLFISSIDGSLAIFPKPFVKVETCQIAGLQAVNGTNRSFVCKEIRY